MRESTSCGLGMFVIIIKMFIIIKKKINIKISLTCNFLPWLIKGTVCEETYLAETSKSWPRLQIYCKQTFKHNHPGRVLTCMPLKWPDEFEYLGDICDGGSVGMYPSSDCNPGEVGTSLCALDWLGRRTLPSICNMQNALHHHRHHLFFKRPFLPRSARVRRFPRYEASPHIPEHCPFMLQTKHLHVIIYTLSPSLPAPAPGPCLFQ